MSDSYKPRWAGWYSLGIGFQPRGLTGQPEEHHSPNREMEALRGTSFLFQGSNSYSLGS